MSVVIVNPAAIGALSHQSPGIPRQEQFVEIVYRNADKGVEVLFHKKIKECKREIKYYDMMFQRYRWREWDGIPDFWRYFENDKNVH